MKYPHCIGDLPTEQKLYDWKKLFLRTLTAKDLLAIHQVNKIKYRQHEQLIRIIQDLVSVDITHMADCDFLYLLLWLRKASFPHLPNTVTYRCLNPVWQDSNNAIHKVSHERAHELGLTYRSCDQQNSELIRVYKPIVRWLPDDFTPHPDIDLPRISTLADCADYMEENPADEFAYLARWVRQGSTFKAKLNYLLYQKDWALYDAIKAYSTHMDCGYYEQFALNCSACGNRVIHTMQPSIMDVFSGSREEDLYNMFYNLMSTFKVAPDLNIPMKLLLFNHSNMLVDKAEAKKRQEAEKLKNQYKPR